MADIATAATTAEEVEADAMLVARCGFNISWLNKDQLDTYSEEVAWCDRQNHMRSE